MSVILRSSTLYIIVLFCSGKAGLGRLRDLMFNWTIDFFLLFSRLSLVCWTQAHSVSSFNNTTDGLTEWEACIRLQNNSMELAKAWVCNSWAIVLKFVEWIEPWVRVTRDSHFYAGATRQTYPLVRRLMRVPRGNRRNTHTAYDFSLKDTFVVWHQH